MKIFKSNILFSVCCCLIILSACQKDKNGNNDPLISKTPAAFTQKVFLEENTGEWCGWCPDGAAIRESIQKANPDIFISVAIHDSDPLEVADYNDWHKAHTKVPGFPSGSVQRGAATGRGSWEQITDQAKILTPTCGIAIVSKLISDNLDVNIYVGTNQNTTHTTRLTVLIIENNVPQSSPGAQSDYGNPAVGPNWQHQHVLRGVLTENEGDLIDLNNLTDQQRVVRFPKVDLKEFNILNPANCEIVAFINVNEKVEFFYERNILNVQSAKFNEVKDWD